VNHFRSVRRRLKLLVGDHPALLPIYLRMTAEGTSRRITPTTQLLVDGFQRSGTTYTGVSIRLAQPRPFGMSTHVHNIAIIKQAVARHLPTLIVVRDPVPCLASYIVWDPSVGLKTVVWEWLHYHRRLLDLAPQVSIATFDQVTTDIGAVVDRLNERFGTTLVRPSDDVDSAAAVEDHIRTNNRKVFERATPSQIVPVPDDGRADALALWRDVIENDVELADQRREAEELFDRLRAYAPS
jgi:hypothetical protein